MVRNNHHKAGDSFYDLLRRLSESYEADLQKAAKGLVPTGRRSKAPRLSSGAGEGSPMTGPLFESGLSVKPPTSFSMPPSEPELPLAPAPRLGTSQSQASCNSNGPGMKFGQGPEECSVDELGEQLVASDYLKPRECFAHKPPSARLKSIGSVPSAQSAWPVMGALQRRTCVLSPSGNFRNAWDLVGVLCLLWDIIIIPLEMFDLPAEVHTALKWISRLEMLFWAADMVLAFFTGFVDHGILVMELPKVRRHYLRNWFYIDLVILMADVVLEFAFVDLLGDVKAAKFLRLVRLLRIIRLGKLTHVSIVLRDQLQSRVACIQLNLGLVILFMILLEHVVACCWHGIGSLADDGSWLDVHNLRHQPVAAQYATAMRWSLSQLGIGGTEIEAVSYAESVYSVVVAFVSLISFSTVISSMTSLVTSLNKAKVEETDQFWLLRKYLRERSIQGGLAERITGFLQYAYHTYAVQIADRPRILELLSKPLRGELNFHLYQGSILKISFLAEVSIVTATYSENAFHKLASEAIAIVDTGDADVVFSTYHEADASYLALQGSFRYVHGQKGDQYVECKSWIAEMALWTKWLHAGDLVSSGFSQLVSMDAQEFCNCISSSLELRTRAHLYAKLYVEKLKQQHIQSDLWLYEDLPDPEREPTARDSGGWRILAPWTWASLGKPPTSQVLPSESFGPDADLS